MSITTRVRAGLRRWVNSGTSTVVAFQNACGVSLPAASSAKGASAASTTPIIRNRLLYIYFLTAAAAGNELFYIVFLPFVLWCVDVTVARRLVVLWGLVYCVGQSCKDYLRLPRPPTPPVARLESHYETEYGFPSTHAMISLVLPFYSLLQWATMGYDTNWVWGLTAACVWCGSITLSRLYVGVHSVADLVGGLVLGGGVLAWGVAWGPQVDGFIISAPYAPVVVLLVCYAAIYLYPAPAAWTNAYGDTALIIAVVAGFTSASSCWIHQFPSIHIAHAALDATVLQRAQNSAAIVFAMLLRMIVGCTVLFLTRSLVKKAAQAVWLPIVLPYYFAYCSQLASPTRALDASDNEDETATENATTAAAVTPTKEQWQLTPIGASAGLTKRGGAKAATPAAATSTANATATTIASPTPLPPQQFRLRLQPGIAFASPSPSPKSGSGSSSPSGSRPGSPPASPLDALLNSPRPPHRLVKDPAGGALLASFQDLASGRDLVINPFQIYLVEIPIKFATYFAVGFNAVLTCPRIFYWLGL